MVNKDLKKNSKMRTVNMMIQSALIIILIVLVANMMVEIKNLQGTARVINYAGLVRGATQRAVKLEVIGNSDDELIEYLDDVLADLKYEDGEYNLVAYAIQTTRRSLIYRLITGVSLRMRLIM